MVEYFSGYPQIVRDGQVIQNITVRLDVLRKIKDNLSLFQFVQIRDGQKPEDIATEYYDNPDLYWIILYINEIVDPYYDWLLTEDQLYDFVVAKYGINNVNAIHHYEAIEGSDVPVGTWVDFGTPFSTDITNLEHETHLNENKRKIKLLKPIYIPQVISEYQKLLRSPTE